MEKFVTDHIFRCPSVVSYNYLRSFLSFRDLTKDLVNCSIAIDCIGLKFVDPTGLCLLKHLFFDLEQRGVSVILTNLSLSSEAYLRRLDLFDGVQAQPYPDRTSGNARNDRQGDLIEITTLHNEGEIANAATKIASTIVHGMGIDNSPDPHGMHPSLRERVEINLEYVFSEILLNALTHGRGRGYKFAHVNIAAQFFPSRNSLDVSVVDNGCGLLETLQGHEKMEGDITDRKAILIARQARVSCNRDAERGLDTRNQGIGLTVSADLALAAGGTCGLFTGTSRQTFYPGGGIFGGEIPFWRGTGAVFRFERAGLTNVDKGAVIAALPGFRSVEAIVFG